MWPLLRSRPGCLLPGLLMLAQGMGGCGGEAPEGLTILAASSLTESLTEAGRRWEAQGRAAPSFSFDASSRLALQIEAGAPADLYFSADELWMDRLEEAGRLAPGSRRALLGNELVVVVPLGSALELGSAAALSQPGLERLGLAGEAVPAGRYARASLRSLGLWGALEPRVVSGDSVRDVLGWVAAGEVQAGLVYATDARVEPRVRVGLALPASAQPEIRYPAARVAASAHPEEAQAFLDWCAGAEGQALFAAAGFRRLAAP